MSKLKIIFAGTPEFAAIILDDLLKSSQQICAVYTQPDRPAGRGQKLQASPVKQLALSHNLPVYQPSSLRDAATQNTLRSQQADLMVVVAYGLLLPEVVLAIPRLGCINVHASLLPRWRGAAPIQRAILHNDPESGVTIMQMDKGLDTGAMLKQLACIIQATDTSQDLHDRLAQLGAKALQMSLEELNNRTAVAIPQNDLLACYAAKISKEEANIQWAQTAVEIDCHIRAFNPWPIAFSYLAGQLVRVWHAQPINAVITAKPGTIISANKQGIEVAAGQGILRLLELQFPGGRALKVSDILNSRAQDFTPGKFFSTQQGEQ